ncbi:site-specific DNA-methyltransferase [Brachyspira aalborgi]|uniref:site-specific DNA-methyltransferase (adenine-specific) n=2 Tax=Brachyspira aalborgi TaxID=29522 RepID=A0A5C8FNU3_9SPIR|nr:site-specific DNA-methyltransferase [Brachyspira aalborgi]TXJ51261.1 site-specific DNA-methyltransferase [Brachyspira aalborgi]
MINKNEAIKNNIKAIDNSIKNELFENLKTNFPQTIIEGKADLKAISLLLGLDKKSDISGYELTWTGKGLSNALYSSPCNKELKLEEIFSNADCKNLNSSNIEMKDSNNPKNIIIRGDNLDVLKILKSAYSEKIKMIYIDPPYNTTNENFIYPDNFRQDYKKILEEVGLIEIDENGQEVESEDLKFFKNIQGSRTHSGWLSFMLPRLKLARDLLKEDGVIFISIDDNEQANLKLLCDEIFGEDNFVACCPVVSNRGGRDYGGIAITHEYILIYQKEFEEKNLNLLVETDKKFQYEDKNGFFNLMELRNRNIKFNSKNRPNLYYPFYVNLSKVDENNLYDISLENKKGFVEVYPLKSQGINTVWRWGKEKALKYLNLEIKAKKKQDGNFMIVQKYRSVLKRQRSIFDDVSFVTEKGSNAVKDLFNGVKVFDYPKSPFFIKRLIEISSSLEIGENENDIILDFFAGSGTTAQAVMELNAEDKGNREFILVQIDEEIKEDKSKSAYDFCKKELKSENPVISDITIERVKRAAQKIIQSSKDNDLNLGFKVFTLEDKPEIIIDKDKNLKLINRRNLSVIDKVVNMFLISGKTLDKKIENIFDGKLYKCEDSFYLISFNKEILKYLIKTQNEYIFIDAYGDIELEDFLNLDAGFKERLKVVY